MDRSEPALVPEWLRSTGTVTGSGTHHSALSSLHSDASSLANHSRNRYSKGAGDFDSPRSDIFERVFSPNSRRSSISNGRHPYSSFSRSHRDKDSDKEKERLTPDHLERDCSDPVASILGGRAQKDVLRRSRSMVSGKQNDVLLQRTKKDSEKSGNSSHINSNGVASGGSIVGSIQKAAFQKDFPSLGAEEMPGIPDLGRVSSPVPTTAVQNLPIGNPSVIGGEGWTSALAEVPSMTGSNSNGSSSAQQGASSTMVVGPSNTMAGLNMAEALAQAPSRARTAPQSSVQTQRLEELALKQSRQLIPMTPVTSKASVLNPSDKTKPKTAAARTAEMSVAGKSGQQQFSSLNLTSQPLRGVKPETSKASHAGKFHVLKPVRENGVSSTLKDASSPTTNSGSRVVSSQPASTPVAVSGHLKSPSVSNSVERKTASVAPNAGSAFERRPSSAQAQSRNDFFNLMRKKSSMNHAPALAESVSSASSPNSEKLGEETKEAATIPVHDNSTVDAEGHHTGRSDGPESTSSANAADLEEEEARFLRSLGWEETAGEDEGLTEEEINSFFEAYMKLNPSSKSRQGMQPRLLTRQPETRAASSDGASELSPSNPEAED